MVAIENGCWHWWGKQFHAAAETLHSEMCAGVIGGVT